MKLCAAVMIQKQGILVSDLHYNSSHPHGLFLEAVWKAVQRSVDTMIVPEIKAVDGLKGRGSS